MFNSIYIPIYALFNTGIVSVSGWWVYGDTFDIYSNNSQYYGVNIWSGYNAITTGSGSAFTYVTGSPNIIFSGYGLTSGIIYRQYELINDNYDDYQNGTLYTGSLLKNNLTGTFWFDKLSSGYHTLLKNLTGYSLSQAFFQNDSFDNYSTGSHYSGIQSGSGYYNILINSGTANIFFTTYSDLYMTENFNIYEVGVSTQFNSGYWWSGNYYKFQSGVSI